MCREEDPQPLPAASTASEALNQNNSNLLKPPPMNRVDFEQARREHLFSLPAFAKQWVADTFLRQKDMRNLPIFLVGLNIITCSLPVAASLFYLELNLQNDDDSILPSRFHLAIAGLCYMVVHLKTFARSFILALHYITHCSIFNRRFRAADHIWKTFLCCFFGIPPGLYYPHHVGMHHFMDNVAPEDMSSTMDYRRGSKWNHFKYMFRFVSMGSFELPFRLWQLKKYNLVLQVLSGAIVFWGGMAVLFQYAPIATLFVFYLPWVICSFSLMQGNFKEHIFVDPEDHENNYKSAFTCINAPSNALTFNTGYHIEHHEEPGLPWFKLPELFLKNVDKHAQNDSLVFSGIGSMEVGTLVLNQQFETLADHYHNVGQPARTRPELIAEFQRRLVPVACSQQANNVAPHKSRE